MFYKYYFFIINILFIKINISFAKFEKIEQHPTITLDDFLGYRHISIIHFNMPPKVVNALFKFIAKEEKTGGLGTCSPRNVSVYLKSGSIPLVSPDGSKTQAKLLKNRKKYYTLEFLSSGDSNEFQISTPPAGDWYAITFRSWTDPDSEKIVQQGLGTACETILDAELSVESANTSKFVDIMKNQTVFLNETMLNYHWQFLIPQNEYIIFNLSMASSCAENCSIITNVVTNEILVGKLFNNSEMFLTFQPYTNYNSFHNLFFRLFSGNSTNITVSLHNDNSIINNKSLITRISLIRKSLANFFSFNYEYIIENSTKSLPIDINENSLSLLTFEVVDVYDVGGTLSIELTFPNKMNNVIVVGCVSLGFYSEITDGSGCKQNEILNAPDLWLNDTKSSIFIPYPEPGNWYLSLKAFQINLIPCECLINCQLNGCEVCNCLNKTSTKVEVNITSSPCIEGKCNSNGECLPYLRGGFVYAACYCKGGYRGFDCADDTYVIPNASVLLRLLMLTLSNLTFLIPIYIAFKREYYTEAIAYSAVMIFSTFYHACEAGDDSIGICIMKLNVLQFCDFYNALLSIWVTLVAMASFGPRLTAFFQLLGAIILALAAEMDRTALWVFLLPAISGCVLIGYSWGSRCKKLGNFSYPGSRYRNIYLPAGLFLVFLGLICYGFFQTKRNYYIIHSFWHSCIAISVVLLLPKRKYMQK